MIDRIGETFIAAENFDQKNSAAFVQSPRNPNR